MFRTLIVLPFLASSVAFASPPPASASTPTEASAPADKPDVKSETQVATPTPVVAAQTPSFVVLDKDLDARLSSTEVAELDALTTDFATVDADKDGSLNRTEYNAWIEVHGDKSDAKAPVKAPAKETTPVR